MRLSAVGKQGAAGTTGPGSALFLHRNSAGRELNMTLTTILIVILILLLVGAVPNWPYSRNWGYGPSGIVGVILLVLLILILMGRI